MHIRLFSVKKLGICLLGSWTFVNRYFAASGPYWGVLLARTGPGTIGGTVPAENGPQSGTSGR